MIQTIFWNLLFFTSLFFYIWDITLQRLLLILEFWNKHFSCALGQVFMLLKTYYQPFADVFKIDVLNIWRPSALLKRDSNLGVFFGILQNFYEQLFYRTPPLAASALNFTLYFQVVNTCCTIWTVSGCLDEEIFYVHSFAALFL